MTDVAAARLRAGGLRLTGPRRKVIDVLAGSDAPLSVDEIAAQLPDVHRSSIYRSLGVLEEVGVIRHLHLPHGPARYERLPAEQRVHLVCEVCGRDEVVGPELLGQLRQRLEVELGFVLDTAHSALSGRCAGCVDRVASPHRHV